MTRVNYSDPGGGGEGRGWTRPNRPAPPDHELRSLPLPGFVSHEQSATALPECTVCMPIHKGQGSWNTCGNMKQMSLGHPPRRPRRDGAVELFGFLLSVHLSVSPSVPVCLSVCPSVYLSLRSSFRLSDSYQSVRPSVRLSISPSVSHARLSVPLTARLHVPPSVFPSVRLSASGSVRLGKVRLPGWSVTPSA